MTWKLINEEILRAFNSASGENEYVWTNHLKGIAHAAQLKLWQWLNEPCTEHNRTLFERKNCPNCMEELDLHNKERL